MAIFQSKLINSIIIVVGDGFGQLRPHPRTKEFTPAALGQVKKCHANSEQNTHGQTLGNRTIPGTNFQL